MNLNIQATNVLKRTTEAAKKYKIVCNEGGSRSSKTWSIFQFFLIKALSGEKFELVIIREKLTWIKDTLLKDFEEITEKYHIKTYPKINPNRPSQVYKVGSGTITFWGLDEPAKAHGRKQEYFWINEAMEVGKKEFDQIEMRTTIGGIIDYNPSNDDHWVFDIQRRDDVTMIKSTMLDNPFLEETIRRKILSYEPTPENIAQGTADSYMWQVYGLGNKARLQGLVFESWDIVESIPEGAKDLGIGLDFGYRNDPTAAIEVYLYNNSIYLNELFYALEMTNDDISDKFEELGIDRMRDIYPDSAEPKSAEELYRTGWNIREVVKGADSINFGLSIMHQYPIHITRKSVNLEMEFRKYKYAEDKDGKALNKPVDKFNHGIDASRYCCMMTLNNKGEIELYNASIFA